MLVNSGGSKRSQEEVEQGPVCDEAPEVCKDQVFRCPERLVWPPTTTQWLLMSHMLHLEPIRMSPMPTSTSVMLEAFSEAKQWSFHGLLGTGAAT